MDFRILGPLEIRDGDRTIPLGGGRQRAVLALLILNRNETVSTDRLVEELWGDRAPATAPKVVQNHVSQLRRVLVDGILVTHGAGYKLRVGPGSVDVGRFEQLLEEGRGARARGDAEEASELLSDALALWRGPPLADFAFDSFAQTEIARLEERRLLALEERIEADLALGRHADLVGELDALVQDNPRRERLHCQLMLALYRSNRQAEALDVYQTARKTLVEELGIEPGRQMRELHKAVLQQDPGLDPAAVAAAPVDGTVRAAFVGREGELAELIAGLDHAFAGRGRLFLLVGGPGIGKSRLAEELTARARARGARVLVGRCWEAGGAPAYWPWVQSLRAYVRESDASALRSELGAGAADVAQIVPELRKHLPDVPEPSPVESEGARFRLFDATAEFLRNASRSRPIVLVLDDLHAADTPSLLLLQFLARELGSIRMLVLGAYRDVDPIAAQPLIEMMTEVVREPVTSRLALGGLTQQAVAEYVDLTASELASPELVSALYEETEGNPLFVGETVRLLALEGLRPGTTARIAIPQSVHDVIARRLAHLAEDSKRVLILAAVLGRDFALATLARMSGLSEDQLLETLDEPMAARVVTDVPAATGRLRFAHVLIRDTLYEELTTARRVLLHRRAVATLEELYGDEPGRHLAELAHHAVAGTDFAKGLGYARRAGDHALALLAYEEAARLYETALEALELTGASDERARCELLLALGEAEAWAGNADRAKRAFLDAAGIARSLDLSRHFARAAGGYAREDTYLRAGADEQLVPLLEEALAALGEGDVELRARLLGRLAGALRDEPARDRRDKLSSEAIELARGTGNPVALAYALDGRAAAIIAPDTVDECLTLAAELGEVAERIGDRVRSIHAHSHRLVALVMVGAISELEAGVEEMSRIATELRQPSELWDVHAGHASLAIAAGKLAEAETLATQALAVGKHAKPEVAMATYLLQQYALGDFRGELEEMEAGLRGLVAEYPARVAFRCALAHLHVRVDQLSEAKRTLDDLAVDRFSALPFDQEWIFGMSLLAETSALLAEADSATVLYELLLPYAAFNAADWPDGMRGSVARYLGLLATTTKRWADAELHFEAGLAINAERGAWAWLAYTQYDYGRMLLERAEHGDADRAAELLASSKALSQEIGLSALAEATSDPSA